MDRGAGETQYPSISRLLWGKDSKIRAVGGALVRVAVSGRTVYMQSK